MSINSAQQMLQQMQQQLMSGQFAQNSMNQLGQAGLGAQNPRNFFSTPFDEQQLRQQVMQQVMGYYGGGMNQSFGTDPYTGSGMEPPDWMQGGFDTKKDWKQSGRPEFDWRNQGVGGPQGLGTQIPGPRGNPNSNPMSFQQGMGGGNNPYTMDTFGNGGAMPSYGGGGQQSFSSNPFPGMPGGMPDYTSMMQNYQPNIDALNNNYGGMIAGGFQQMFPNGMPTLGGGGLSGGGSGGGMGGGGFNQGYGGGNFNKQLSDIYRAGEGRLNLDFENQRNRSLQDLYGRGMNASSIGADTMGQLNYGKQEALNSLTGDLASKQLELQKAMIANSKPGTFGGGSGGGFGGGGGGFSIDGGPSFQPSFQGFGGQTQDAGNALNILQGQLGKSSRVPLSFDQQMQLADRQLAQSQLGLQGQLGFGGLGMQGGGLGLQQQGLGQDFLSQIMGQGLARQQGAAGFNQSDMARMQQYLMGNQQMMAGIGSQNAQLEAQKQSFWKQLLMAGIGGASSFFSGGFGGGA